jgi:hypothetical protein
VVLGRGPGVALACKMQEDVCSLTMPLPAGRVTQVLELVELLKLLGVIVRGGGEEGGEEGELDVMLAELVWRVAVLLLITPAPNCSLLPPQEMAAGVTHDR